MYSRAKNTIQIALHLYILLYAQVHHDNDNFQLTDRDNLKDFTGIREFENLETSVMEM